MPVTDEIIVDHDMKAALGLVAKEPALGPIARELFEAEELYGNARPDHPDYEKFERRVGELHRLADGCRSRRSAA